MKRQALQWILAVATLTMATAAMAGNLSDPAFRAKIAKQFPGVKASDIAPAPAPGLWQIFQNGVVGYISADGQFLIDGDMVDLKTNQNVSELKRRKWRVRQLAKVDPNHMLIYAPAKAEKVKHTLTIFTDIDCHYCRLLHADIGKLTKAGIRVRYLFFPLAGPDSSSFTKAESVWCSKHPKAAFDRAMHGLSIPGKPGCGSPVAAQYKLAVDTLGLSGTPTIITATGRLLPAGMSAAGLIKAIDKTDTNATVSLGG